MGSLFLMIELIHHIKGKVNKNYRKFGAAGSIQSSKAHTGRNRETSIRFCYKSKKVRKRKM